MCEPNSTYGTNSFWVLPPHILLPCLLRRTSQASFSSTSGGVLSRRRLRQWRCKLAGGDGTGVATVSYYRCGTHLPRVAVKCLLSIRTFLEAGARFTPPPLLPMCPAARTFSPSTCHSASPSWLHAAHSLTTTPHYIPPLSGHFPWPLRHELRAGHGILFTCLSLACGAGRRRSSRAWLPAGSHSERALLYPPS